MRQLLKLVTIALRCVPAFFRSRSKQAVVELALRQLLATFAEKGWRAREVQAELEKLGIFVGLSTVSRHLPKRDPDRDQRQRWSTFLQNHKHDIAAMDFLVVPTAGFRLLYAWFVIGHDRREILHFGVTEHPTSSWVMQQLREAFPDDTAPRFLICDNDSIFSDRAAQIHRTVDSPSIDQRLRPKSLDCLVSVDSIIDTNSGMRPDSCDPDLGKPSLAPPDE